MEMSIYHPNDLLNFHILESSVPPLTTLFDMLNIEVFNYFTLKHKGETLAIIGFAEYAKDRYYIQGAYSENLNVCGLRLLKKFFHNIQKSWGIKRIETETSDSPVLNRFHEVVGFSLEGVKPMKIDEQNFNCWGMTWKQ